MKNKKICGNCIFWIKNADEKNMGVCHFKSNANPKLSAEKPVPKGIAIRNMANYNDGDDFYFNMSHIKAYFGRFFGCIYFKKKTK